MPMYPALQLDDIMRESWNQRAISRETAMNYIINTFTGPETLFYASGEKHWLDIQAALARAGAPPASGVGVELGCGMGRMTGWIAPHFAKLYALDISDAMIAMAPPLANVEYIATATLLSVPRNIDFVLSFLVLQHMDKAAAWGYIDEAQEVLMHGGIFCAQVHRTEIPVNRQPFDTLAVRGWTVTEVQEQLGMRVGWTPLLVLEEAGVSEPFRWLVLRKE
jgi:SAM-dependent methyltransferase